MTDDEMKAELVSLGWELHPYPEGHIDYPLIRAVKWFSNVGIRETASDKVPALYDNAKRFEDLYPGSSASVDLQPLYPQAGA